jgi:hypothetical protein
VGVPVSGWTEDAAAFTGREDERSLATESSPSFDGEKGGILSISLRPNELDSASADTDADRVCLDGGGGICCCCCCCVEGEFQSERLGAMDTFLAPFTLELALTPFVAAAGGSGSMSMALSSLPDDTLKLSLLTFDDSSARSEADTGFGAVATGFRAFTLFVVFGVVDAAAALG